MGKVAAGWGGIWVGDQKQGAGMGSRTGKWWKTLCKDLRDNILMYVLKQISEEHQLKTLFSFFFLLRLSLLKHPVMLRGFAMA